MSVSKRDFTYKCLVYALFTFLILLIHIPMTYVGDDLTLLPNIGNYSLWERFLKLYSFNGRIFTDVLANAFYRVPMVVWKLFDTLIYVAISMLISYLFTENTYKDILAVCMLILLYPFSYLSTAGYICVSTNYVYTILGLLLILIPFKQIRTTGTAPIWQHFISLFSILYVTNHDQTAMVLIGGLFLYLIYAIAAKTDKKLIHITAIYLIISVGCYAFMFFMPGHINRMTSTSEMEKFLPEYANWSFLKKIYHGYTSTVAHIIYNDVRLFCLFCFLLFLLALSRKSIGKILIASIPLAIFLLVNIFGKTAFIHTQYGLPELLSLSGGIQNAIPLLLSVIVLISIFYTVCTAVENRQNMWFLLLLMVLAAGSREMMGFSATIYASSYRTFTFFLYATILCCLLLINDLKKKNLWPVAMAATAVLLFL